MDRDAVASWRPPSGTTARIFTFDPRVGGPYRMAFVYAESSGGRRRSTRMRTSSRDASSS
ncbi:SRPBCC family protein [Flavisphingomonas formosensis]|uniref:hypothetical protein n=1 Tax=Flavisphingomonas formosensis TaxID=861534 RepID=UPI0022B76971|nr:hypothetical protein [Sphingomonas formosensis]